MSPTYIVLIILNLAGGNSELAMRDLPACEAAAKKFNDEAPNVRVARAYCIQYVVSVNP